MLLPFASICTIVRARTVCESSARSMFSSISRKNNFVHTYVQHVDHSEKAESLLLILQLHLVDNEVC